MVVVAAEIEESRKEMPEDHGTGVEIKQEEVRRLVWRWEKTKELVVGIRNLAE